MNFNANASGRQPFGRKTKRVSDVNSMGYNPYAAAPQPPQQPYVPAAPVDNLSYPQGFQPPYDVSQQAPQNFNIQQPSQPQPNINMFAQPMVQDMALQYGQQLASTGKNMVTKEIERYVSVSKLKYYFAVDTKYVLSKLGLLFFPFTHSDWSIKYANDNPVQPRYEINAPDLYIPSMGYITFVLVAGLVLGMQKRFSPEQIGIQASSALAWWIFELAIYLLTMYITNIKSNVGMFDLLAYTGYKFVGIIVSVLISILTEKTGYYAALGYLNLALAFFLMRSLKGQVLSEQQQPQTNSYYGDGNVYQTGNKRRLYFLLFVALTQPVLSWWLSFHLIGNVVNATTA